MASILSRAQWVNEPNPQHVFGDYTFKITTTSSNEWIVLGLATHIRVMQCTDSALTLIMMMSSNGNLSRVTGPLCGEFTDHRWIPLTKASDAELWRFLSSVPAWINGWVNNREAGDLRRHRARYDVIVMIMVCRLYRALTCYLNQY